MSRIAWCGVVLAMCVARSIFAGADSPGAGSRSVAAGPLVVSPTSVPRTAAAIVAARPAGQRTLLLTGFDRDIASSDRVSFPASRSGPAIVLPSPWLSAGSAVAQARIVRWLNQFKSAGGTADRIIAAIPPESASTLLASSTYSSLSRLSADRRFASLVRAHPTALAASASGSPSRQAWRSVIQLEVEAASARAHASAVRSALGPIPVVVGSVAATPALLGASTPSASSPAGAVANPGPASNSIGRDAAVDPSVLSAAASFVAMRGFSPSDPQSQLLGAAASGSGWDRLFQMAATNAEARRILDFAVASADAISVADSATFRRPSSFSQIPSDLVDPLALNAGQNRDARALAMSDCLQADLLRRDGVTLALAVRRAGKPEHSARMIEMLEEVAQWNPFQRQGWSLDTPTRALPDGGDGVGMATSWTIVGLVDILDILGDRIPSELRFRLQSALRREVGSVVDSWVSARPWYVRSDTVISNQWIDPNSAAVLACLHLRDERLRPIYDLAVVNLVRSVDGLQPDGSFLEGMAYAQMSLPALFRASDAMAAAGDRRLADRPFTTNNWRWMMHMQMPGGNLVSSGDCRLSTLPAWAVSAPLDSFALSAIAAGTSDALGSVRSLFPNCGIWGSAATYASRLVSVAPRANPALDPWAFFPSQQLVTWRESWGKPTDASREIGIWVKGGSLLERSHGHRDQGHVSVFRGATPILMERGTPAYGNPSYLPEYASARGHGIMQIDPVDPPNAAVSAPVTINRLDSEGGDVRVDSTAAYRTALRCRRGVTWDAHGSVAIRDDVLLRDQQPAGTEFFRFHLGATAMPHVTQVDGGWLVEWDAARVIVTSDVPIRVFVTPSGNALRAPFVHHVLSVRSAAAAYGMAVSTEVTVLR